MWRANRFIGIDPVFLSPKFLGKNFLLVGTTLRNKGVPPRKNPFFLFSEGAVLKGRKSGLDLMEAIAPRL